MVSAITASDLQANLFFQDLDLPDLETLLLRHSLARLPSGQTLIMQDEWVETLIVLLEGIAKVRTFSADGDEVVIALLGAGDLLGEMPLIDGDRRSADVVTVTPVRVLKLQVRPFLTILQQRPALALKLAQLETGRLRDINRRFALQKSDATTRVLDAMAYLARKCSMTDDPLQPIPPLPQNEIAILAGLARETFSRTLSKLRQRGTVLEDGGSLRLASLKPLKQRGLVS